ncbi:MAG: amino acid permease [Desulfitobacteriaceae bacterium]
MSKPSTDALLERESGLHRQLEKSQLTMIAIGGAIGTGLFLGSGFAVGLAGPGVILSYMIGVLITLIMMYALSEMTVVHPTAGSFGVLAEHYVNPWAGFVVRYTYWIAQVVAIGGEVTAAAIYMKLWFPNVPMVAWVVLFSIILIAVNLTSVKNFGTIEYWFAMIKVTAIIFFIILGVGYLFNGYGQPAPALTNLTAHGGFLPNGFSGVLKAMLIVIFSFYGIEVIAVTAGEAKNPEQAIPKAMKSMVFRLSLFYILAIALVVAIVPWSKAGLGESPFVTVFRSVGIPYAAGVMNFVVLTAALSSMNTNLYLTGRMLFSLSRGGYAPKAFGKLTEHGSPRNAVLASTVGLFLAAFLSIKFADSAYMYLFGVAIFGGIFVWIMILVSILRFRKIRETQGLPQSPFKMPLFPVLPWIGILALVAILIDCFFIGLGSAWYAGVPWLLFLTVVYFLLRKRGVGQNQPRMKV